MTFETYLEFSEGTRIEFFIDSTQPNVYIHESVAECCGWGGDVRTEVGRYLYYDREHWQSIPHCSL